MKKSFYWLGIAVITNIFVVGYFVYVGHYETAFYSVGIAIICFSNLIKSLP
jgi:hypothetical protein